ncbi:MAG: 50S ribosomal protein L10 [bacterium]|nr:50S ribosomal protein L10 [bacterium]
MDRQNKEQLIDSMRQVLASSSLVVVTHQSGLTVSEASELRRKIREAGASYKVLKNTLARLAFSDTDHSELAEIMKGPTALAFSEDPVAAARAVAEFAKENDKLSIVGGSMGQGAMDASAIHALAKLPSLDELRAKLIALLQAPATKVAGVLQAPAGQLARVFSAYGAKG